MNITIQAVHFDADIKLKELIREKLSNLVRFYNEILNVDVFLKLENSGQVKDKIVELKANIPGKSIVVTSTGKSFESSLDEAHDIIIRQLKRHKEKMRA
ncbi:MAG: ribosome-associated translation inhibitor RaiA [Saprospiraceae bacterium]|jgi:putative sigma-54 modulation protein|nr:ribosome-associated translation inhibitor RaiA [Saprospiraceae bacterium]MBK8634886.1 ribosome-associated translation inhibitor RaiA [Saprospiraceae bacterium]HMS68343.1 ribosome-associated translation inhibitor RaiA [Saprospiraceae bacterium]HOY12595.1 ribosome-associated translation inhibitor RaiA [Saprospiraceae bacterium]HPN71129.1 ribosome-associated translation inhibitor RaiA [Saprospiraceae bacterium]